MTDIGDMIERGSDGQEWEQCRSYETESLRQECWRWIERATKAETELAALRAEVERLREERRWIPVAEELPDDGEDVICAYADFESFAGFREGDVWFDQDAQWLKIPPTHWQPLPAPPVEEEE